METPMTSRPDNRQDTSAANAQASDQRQALKQSEKNASAQQPGSFKEKETEQKIVEIGADMADSPIKGIDPPSDKPASGK
jgi:hypothetical protein